MTLTPNDQTLYEVVAANHDTVGYFADGDEARAYAKTVPGSRAMIYLKPVSGL